MRKQLVVKLYWAICYKLERSLILFQFQLLTIFSTGLSLDKEMGLNIP